MLRQGQQKRLVRAKVNGQWQCFSEYQLQPQGTIHIKTEQGSFIIPAEDWKEVAEAPKVPSEAEEARVATGSSSSIDLMKLKPGAPKPRKRLKSKGVPPEQVAMTFFLVGAGLLLVLIIAALITRM
ncbi:MAG: hypothetical protein AAGF97_14600 [Planctomycetota bacterium]